MQELASVQRKLAEFNLCGDNRSSDRVQQRRVNQVRKKTDSLPGARWNRFRLRPTLSYFSLLFATQPRCAASCCCSPDSYSIPLPPPSHHSLSSTAAFPSVRRRLPDAWVAHPGVPNTTRFVALALLRCLDPLLNYIDVGSKLRFTTANSYDRHHTPPMHV